MWPSMNIWLLRVLPLSAYFSHSLCISLFSVSHACISPSIIRFQEFPLGVAQVLRAEKMAAPAFFPPRSLSVLSPTEPSHSLVNIIDKNICQVELEVISSVSTWSRTRNAADRGCTWRLTVWPLPHRSWPLNSPADHKTLLSCPLPRELQETGSCDPAVYTAMERPITAVTWQVTRTMRPCELYFLTNFCFPPRPRPVSQDIYLKCLKKHEGFKFWAWLFSFICTNGLNKPKELKSFHVFLSIQGLQVAACLKKREGSR